MSEIQSSTSSKTETQKNGETGSVKCMIFLIKYFGLMTGHIDILKKNINKMK